jgi:hypothetical protein
MDVYENGIFYGPKLHPAQADVADADFSNLFGLGNPEKRAARKQAKAEKKLAKAQTANPKKAARLTKAANRKLVKVDKIVNKYGLTQTSVVDVGTQDEEDEVLNTTATGVVATQPVLTAVPAPAVTPTNAPVCMGGMGYYEETPQPKTDMTKIMIYGGIGLATIFMVGVLLSRKGEVKMATK